MKNVCIFIEGGGKGDTNRNFRVAFQTLFRTIRERFSKNQIEFNVVMGGGRSQTYALYVDAINRKSYSHAYLLVDSEVFVNKAPWEHVARDTTDNWNRVGEDDHLQFFVTVMETWFLVDRAALQRYYAGGFDESKLVSHSNPECTPKDDVFMGLNAATKHSKKGSYDKGGHAYRIIEGLDPSQVRKLRFAERLFSTLESIA